MTISETEEKGGLIMPRGKKKIVEPAPVEVVEIKAPEPAIRKPYPTYEERIAAAEQNIARLTALKASREALVEQTAAKLRDRQEALAKSEAALNAVIAKRDRLIVAKDKLAKEPKAALKAAEKQKLNELLLALKASGKSIDELLAELKK